MCPEQLTFYLILIQMRVEGLAQGPSSDSLVNEIQTHNLLVSSPKP